MEIKRTRRSCIASPSTRQSMTSNGLPSSFRSLLPEPILTIFQSPYENVGQALADIPRELKRKFKKLIGFPASPDVGALGNVLKQLRSKTEEELGHAISTVVTASPRLKALYEEDIVDAIEYAGLKPLTNRAPFRQPHELSAAYAGNGLGLCKHYVDFGVCQAEENRYLVRARCFWVVRGRYARRVRIVRAREPVTV